MGQAKWRENDCRRKDKNGGYCLRLFGVNELRLSGDELQKAEVEYSKTGDLVEPIEKAEGILIA